VKRPSFQFYPSDWRKDTALQFCSLPARGLWVEMMCIAHECEPYGFLVVNGKPMTPAQIGRLVGIGERECKKLLDELFDAGVPSKTEEGVIFSRRMVRDEEIRNKRAAGGNAGAEHGSKGASHGSKGGRPTKQNTPQITPLGDDGRGVIEPPKEPPPSSSSSSSPSVNPSEQSSSHTQPVVVTTFCKPESEIPDPPTTEAHWLNWLNREAGTQFDASSRFDRKDLWPILRRWCDAGLTQHQIMEAIRTAQSSASKPIANLPKYIDRVLANSQAPPARQSPADSAKLAAARAIFGTEIEGDNHGQSARVIDAERTTPALRG